MTSPEPSVPYGFCHCGCGQKTQLYKQTVNALGVKKGDPYAFLLHHHANKGPNEHEPVVVDGEPCIKIRLSDERCVLVSAADYPTVSTHRWFYQASTDKNTYYARTNIRFRTGQGGQKPLLMHRLIMGAMGDHRNGDGWDNRRSNLRAADWQQNGRNKKKRTVTSSQYKGVRPRGNGRYTASIGHRGKTICLGTYGSEVESAKAYDAAARKLHGEFAHTNF